MRYWFSIDFVPLCCVTNVRMHNDDCFLFSKYVGKKVSYSVGHTSRHLNLKLPHRYDSDGASVSEIKNLENHNLIGGLVFKFPVHFTARQEFFKTPFAVQNDGDSVSGFGPDTPPFSDLTGCLKKIGRRTLVRNLLR